VHRHESFRVKGSGRRSVAAGENERRRVRSVRQREQGKALRDTACTIYTVPHTMINVY
jgi:hypothetical protein